MVSTRTRSYSNRRVEAARELRRRSKRCKIHLEGCRLLLSDEREESARLNTLYKCQRLLKRRAKERLRLSDIDLADAKERHASDADRIDDLQTSCEGYIDQIQDRDEYLCEKDRVIREKNQTIRELRARVKQFEAVLPQDWPTNPRLPALCPLPPPATGVSPATDSNEIDDFTLNPPPILSALRRPVTPESPVPDGPLFPDTPKVISPSGRVHAPPTPPPSPVKRLRQSYSPEWPRWSPLRNSAGVYVGVSDLFV